MKILTIIIEDISDGKGEAFKATFPELNNSIAFVDNLKELMKGIELTIDTAKKEKMGIYAWGNLLKKRSGSLHPAR